MKTGTRQTGKFAAWALLIAAPLLGYAVLWLMTGCAPWRVDAWNSRWNDEMAYYRAVRLIRTYLWPQGVTGYNEVLNTHLTYGPYTPFTYLIYVAFSFLTGYHSHNFMYAINVLMAVLAGLIFIALVRPDRKKTLWMFAFFFVNILWTRHAWSGMVEESYSFYMVIFAGLVIYENLCLEGERKHPVAAIVAMVLLTAYFSLMRPFYVLLEFFPFYYVIRYRKRISSGTALQPQGDHASPASGSSCEHVQTDAAVRGVPKQRTAGGRAAAVTSCVLILALIPALLYAFIYLRNNYVAVYFSSSPNTVENFLTLLFGGDLREGLDTIVSANVKALQLMRKDAGSVTFYFMIFMLDVTEWILLLIMLIRSIREKPKNRQKIFTLLMFLLFSLAVYEATVVLYSGSFVHRMTEAAAFAIALILIYYGHLSRPVLVGVTAALTIALGVRNPSLLRFPARSEASLTAEQADALTGQYEQIMPYDESGDPWNNTLARPLILTKYYSDLFPVPTYLSMNVFQKSALKEAIGAETLRSKYLMVDLSEENADLRELAEDHYQVLAVFRYVEILLVHE